ncbi:MAG: hypothetical protein PHY28_04525 [Dehalococcoidales bacterium]|nr:hypothetical protein [Dehalococcoidales bacterium]
MSKDKKKKTKVLSTNVISSCDGYWEWFDRSDIPTAPYEITGKYLFFSMNRGLLIEIAIDELENGGFHRAKTHMTGITPPSGEYVLCLYYKDDSRKHELAKKYGSWNELKYRYWKSDADTLAGKYSKQFLDELSSNDQKMFQGKREKQ